MQKSVPEGLTFAAAYERIHTLKETKKTTKT